jgi:glycosyltransferase involved in cell wall biosynthesis
VDASSPDAIAQALNSVLADENLRAQLSANARAARKRYCWEIEERVLVDLYAELLAEDPRGEARG